MNIIMRLMLVSLLMLVAAPAYSNQSTQIWKCELVGDTSEEEVTAMAQAWLKAAKGVQGGEGIEAYVYFPVAVNVVGNTDLLFLVVAPSFTEWGKFWDNYPNSPAAELENKGKIVCPDSALWQSIKIK